MILTFSKNVPIETVTLISLVYRLLSVIHYDLFLRRVKFSKIWTYLPYPKKINPFILSLKNHCYMNAYTICF